MFKDKNTNNNLKGLSDLIKQILLKDLMNMPPIILHVDESFAMVEKTLREHRIKHLPIVNDSNKLVGIITLSDLYRTCAPRRRPEDGSFFYSVGNYINFLTAENSYTAKKI